jgi:hypothetical protein
VLAERPTSRRLECFEMDVLGTTAALTLLGGLHGFVVWLLVFRLVKPIVHLIVRRRPVRLPFSEAVAYLVVAPLLIVCAFLLLQSLGFVVSPEQSREKFGRLFVGSMVGLVTAGAIQRAEAGIRRRRQRPGRGPGQGGN